jgi:hypothetical protein
LEHATPARLTSGVPHEHTSASGPLSSVHVGQVTETMW